MPRDKKSNMKIHNSNKHLLDIFSDDLYLELGSIDYDPLNDLLNKKYSLPIIYTFSLQNDISKKLEEYYKKNEPLGIFSNDLIEIIGSNGGIPYALAIKNLYKYSALKLIETKNLSAKGKSYLKKLMK